jgi:hypothetical protein
MTLRLCGAKASVNFFVIKSAVLIRTPLRRGLPGGQQLGIESLERVTDKGA